MRIASILLVFATLCIVALPGLAQQTSGFSTMFTGADPRKITPIKVNLPTKSVQDLNAAFHKPAPAKAFSISNVLPKMSMPSWPPKIATPTILTPKNNPFQPMPITGVNPFALSK